MKKLIALTMCASMLMASSVSAATYKLVDWDEFYSGDKWTVEDGDGKGNDIDYSVPNTFSKSWSRKIQWAFKEEGGVVYNACLATVGFDTWCTDEDYIKDVYGSATYSVCGAVKNSEGTWSGDTSWGNSWKKSNKTDVEHTGKKVTYWLALGYKVK